MQKIIQITDCHLVSAGGTIFESDPNERLAAAIDDINRNHGDADLCVFTGDLAHHGDRDAYLLLRERLSALTVPWHLLPGNHDDRATLLEIFPEIAHDGPFVQSTRRTAAGTFAFLDTINPGVHSGRFCEARRMWLDTKLAEAGSEPVYLFMHHGPMSIELPHIDQYIMAEGEEFADALRRHGNVRHIFFGHVHRPVSGSWHGIPFSALRGTNHQSWLDFKPSRANITSLEPPCYAVIFIDRQRTVVHFHDFMDDSPKFLYDPDASEADQIRRV